MGGKFTLSYMQALNLRKNWPYCILTNFQKMEENVKNLHTSMGFEILKKYFSQGILKCFQRNLRKFSVCF